MRQIWVAVVVVCALFAGVAWGRPEGAYSVNIHFVPAILRDTCTAGQTFKPTNYRCTQCLCIANRFARCVPEFGCKPLDTTTTARPNEAESSTSLAPPAGGGGENPAAGGGEGGAPMNPPAGGGAEEPAESNKLRR